MARSHFFPLARLEGQGMITVCRHGIVHLSWHNFTIRLRAENFQRLAHLLERGDTLAASFPLYDGGFSIAVQGEEYRITIDWLELVLEPEEYLALIEMALKGRDRLEQALASDDWPGPDPFTFTPLGESHAPHFSLN